MLKNLIVFEIFVSYTFYLFKDHRASTKLLSWTCINECVQFSLIFSRSFSFMTIAYFSNQGSTPMIVREIPLMIESSIQFHFHHTISLKSSLLNILYAIRQWRWSRVSKFTRIPWTPPSYAGFIEDILVLDLPYRKSCE